MTNDQPGFPNNSYDKDGLPITKHSEYNSTNSLSSHNVGFPSGQQSGHQNPQQSDYGATSASAVPATSVGYGMAQPNSPQKSWVVAAILAFFLGSVGAHNFYLGRKVRGGTQLLLTILGYLTMILLVGYLIVGFVGLWAFLEFILILVGAGSYRFDSNGQPLKK